MTRKQDNANRLDLKRIFTEQEDFLRGLIQQVVQQVLEAEMEEALGVQKGQAHSRIGRVTARATTAGR
jgi:transposase-like protein